MIKVFLTNLTEYTKGYLKGKWINLPMDEQKLKQVVNNIIKQDEEHFITDQECPFHINEYDNIYELNNIMQDIKELNLDKNEFSALCKSSTLSEQETLEKIINNDYTILEVTNNEKIIDGSDIAYTLYEEGYLSFLQIIPDHLIDYIDWDQIWRECEIAYNWNEITINNKQYAVNI